jgi:hypothetical protein
MNLWEVFMSPRAVNAMFLFIAALMIGIIFRTKPSLWGWLSLVGPLIALWGFWSSVQDVKKSASLFETSVKLENERAFPRMRQKINIAAGMGLFAIITAMFAGLTIGQEAAHQPALWIHR